MPVLAGTYLDKEGLGNFCLREAERSGREGRGCRRPRDDCVEQHPDSLLAGPRGHCQRLSCCVHSHCADPLHHRDQMSDPAQSCLLHSMPGEFQLVVSEGYPDVNHPVNMTSAACLLALITSLVTSPLRSVPIARVQLLRRRDTALCCQMGIRPQRSACNPGVLVANQENPSGMGHIRQHVWFLWSCRTTYGRTWLGVSPMSARAMHHPTWA